MADWREIDGKATLEVPCEMQIGFADTGDEFLHAFLDVNEEGRISASLRNVLGGEFDAMKPVKLASTMEDPKDGGEQTRLCLRVGRRGFTPSVQDGMLGVEVVGMQLGDPEPVFDTQFVDVVFPFPAEEIGHMSHCTVNFELGEGGVTASVEDYYLLERSTRAVWRPLTD